MLAIKLRPIGKRGYRTFRVAVMEKKSKLKGGFIDDLGWYNNHTNKFSVDAEKAKKWMSNGAKPTDTVFNIFVNAKIVDSPKIQVKMKRKPEKSETAQPVQPQVSQS